jgi:hypothetical protein
MVAEAVPDKVTVAAEPVTLPEIVLVAAKTGSAIAASVNAQRVDAAVDLRARSKNRELLFVNSNIKALPG